jgi:hypothetical protein
MGSHKLSWSESLIFPIPVPHSLGCQAHATVPSYWVRWGVVKYLPGLAWNLNQVAYQIAMITGMSHQNLAGHYYYFFNLLESSKQS